MRKIGEELKGAVNDLVVGGEANASRASSILAVVGVQQTIAFLRRAHPRVT
jgi:hypothetical protein